MKKILAFAAVIFIVFIGLTYWSVSSTSREFSTCKIESFEDLNRVNFREHDSVILSPSTLYKGNLLKELMQGQNYRKAWSTPVKVPIGFLDQLEGGLEILKEGGGKQTHSLKLKSQKGVMFTLRSVTKDPEKLVPEAAEELGLENIIIDGISGQHPYGAILAAELSDIAGIQHTHPRIYFIPKQPALGKFNKKYGNRIFLLEYETESKVNWTNIPNIENIIETKDLQELKQKKGDQLSIDKSELIRLRLFDLLIGDWDRHAEQWGWAIQNTNDGLRAIPIPGDRDNAFFNLQGVIPAIITNKNIEPLVRPFEKEIDYMPGLVYPFDRYFLMNTPKSKYLEQAEFLQNSMTDEAIDNAFRIWPDQLAKLDKSEISEKLRSRRDHLTAYASSFHSIIQEQGKLTEALKGSEDAEIDKDLIPCFDCEPIPEK